MTPTLNLLGYDPRCSLYRREQTPGKKIWYINYFLPNGKRQRRPCHADKKLAKQMLDVKRLQLFKGEFDAKDLAKMEDLFPKEKEPERLSIDQALELYLETTSGQRTAQAQYNDTHALQMLFGRLKKQGKSYMDQIKPIDVQRLVNVLDKEGKAEASLHTYVQCVNKVFNWWIEEMEELNMKNPVKKVVIPKSTGRVRDRIPTTKEVQALLAAPYEEHGPNITPIVAIMRFLLCTGARLGEVLNCEWSDFDLEKGIWHIRHKKCPTPYGMQWSPKWHKERSIVLFPDALEILQQQPRLKTYGSIPKRDENGKLIDKTWHSAQFVFPKKEVRLSSLQRKIRYTRVDRITKAWKGLLKAAKVSDLTPKDLRTYFNYLLIDKYGMTSKEAGAYIGNSEVVNHVHYSPVNAEIMRGKIFSKSLSECIGVTKTLLQVCH